MKLKVHLVHNILKLSLGINLEHSILIIDPGIKMYQRGSEKTIDQKI
jgi:hypothetical protein